MDLAGAGPYQKAARKARSTETRARFVFRNTEEAMIESWKRKAQAQNRNDATLIGSWAWVSWDMDIRNEFWTRNPHHREKSFAQIYMTRFSVKNTSRSRLGGGGVINFLKIWLCLLLYIKNGRSNIPPPFKFTKLKAFGSHELLNRVRIPFCILLRFYGGRGETLTGCSLSELLSHRSISGIL